MPFLTSFRRAFPAVALLAAFASAQTCYYPDGKTISPDTPCNTTGSDSACCSTNSFCLVGGLCFTGGVLTRGSCTDSTWESDACAGYCRTVTTNGESGITPCDLGVSENTFVCGLSPNQCSDNSKTFNLASDLSVVLRPAQIATLVGPALAAASASGKTGAGTFIGIAAGVALPLLLALGLVGFLLYRERRKFGSRGSMIKLPDDSSLSHFSFQPPPMIGETLQYRTSHASGRSSIRSASTRPSIRSMNSAASRRPGGAVNSPGGAANSPIQSPRPTFSPKPGSYKEPQRLHSFAESRRSQVASFAERFEAVKVTPQLVDVRESSSQSRHELESWPSTPRDVERFELAAARMSR